MMKKKKGVMRLNGGRVYVGSVSVRRVVAFNHSPSSQVLMRRNPGAQGLDHGQLGTSMMSLTMVIETRFKCDYLLVHIRPFAGTVT